MQETFSTKDMVDFGNYILSSERNKLLRSHPNKKNLVIDTTQVYHADIENYKAKKNGHRE